jgi:hypothetical protein
MRRITQHIVQSYRIHFRDKDYIISLVTALLLLLLSLYINFFAGTFASRFESNPVTDIVLSNIRVYDVDFIFIYGSFIQVFVIALLCIFEPKHAPFTLKTIALFTIIRSIFISLTHIGPFPTHLVINPTSFINKFTFDGDLFFSGHTGLPFLIALIFWKNKYLRFLFLASSLLFGVTVLLAHLHYTIDVLAAFFITYSIYHIGEFLFRHDRRIFFRSPHAHLETRA